MFGKKAVLSLLSIVLSGIFMFMIFSSSSLDDTLEADIKIDGVSGKIYDFTDKIIGKIYNEPEKEKSVKNLNTKVYLGGYPVGLKLYADGVVVVGTEAVDSPEGFVNPARKAGIKVGDVIKRVDGKVVRSNNEVSQIIEESKGKDVKIFIQRGEKQEEIVFRCEYSISEEKYKAGIWIRDSSAGIGTVTFCTRDGLYASLGHPVCDIDTKKVLPISQGECTKVRLNGFIKSTSGNAGELCGFLEEKCIGKVYSNGELGVYGKFSDIPSATLYELASENEVKTGKAVIYTTIENGCMEQFEIEIVRINYKSEDNKNLTIKVTDQRLIDKTGGIVQGMSGSPIVQNGKIVGAVTHVFLNDPTGGYGIFASTMLETLKTVSEQHLKKAS